MFENGIPHASFPYDDSPWVAHFQDSAEQSRRAQARAAHQADVDGHDLFARHIMATAPGRNPFANYRGPFFEGRQGAQFTRPVPNQLYMEYFGNWTPPGGRPGMGPFSDPTTQRMPGAIPNANPMAPPGSAPATGQPNQQDTPDPAQPDRKYRMAMPPSIPSSQGWSPFR